MLGFGQGFFGHGAFGRNIKKYWKYIAAALGLILSILGFIFLCFLKKKQDEEESQNVFVNTINETAKKMAEAKHVAEIEAVVAKTKEESVIEELSEIKKTKDPKERRKQLIFLHNRVRKS